MSISCSLEAIFRQFFRRYFSAVWHRKTTFLTAPTKHWLACWFFQQRKQHSNLAKHQIYLKHSEMWTRLSPGCLKKIHSRLCIPFHTLTGNVRLSGEDGVLELVGHHCEFIIRRPVDGDGVVGSRAQLLSNARSIWSCRGRKEESGSTRSHTEYTVHPTW